MAERAVMKRLLASIAWLPCLWACSTGGGMGHDTLASDGLQDGVGDLEIRDERVIGDLPPGQQDGRPPYQGCIEAEGSTPLSGDLDESRGKVSVDAQGQPCQRVFVLASTAQRRDNLPSSPRTFSESLTAPSVATHNTLFDALYALALEEMRENSVAAIQDAAFDNGTPLPCPGGGCFETGRLWRYVWTRDISYAADLALAALDPPRVRNSLELKTSNLRDGSAPQIVQDTGTGGSYPISTDRAVWALGAERLLNVLHGSEREAFRDGAAAVVFNTIEHDRAVVYDARDGLYRGEQSFLDWREQSYPAWVSDDPVHIGMSKALSTNLCHLRLLELGAKLAGEKGLAADAGRYGSWANGLRAAVADSYTLGSSKLVSSFLTTELDQAPTQQYDLLGTALAVLFDVFGQTQARDVVARFPHLPFGAPVIWPQQQGVPIYHNRAIWPFVSAYWLKAARRVRNADVVDHNVRSLVHGAALNLSNMENLELVSGAPYVDDGALSGPVVNSQRQLWSVAGYLSMVQDVIFGLEIEEAGIRARPFVTVAMRHGIFAAADTLVLNNFPYRGHRVSVVVHLPARRATPHEGAYDIASVRLDGVEIGARFIHQSELSGAHRLDVQLEESNESSSGITLIGDVSDDRTLFAPRPPRIGAVTLVDGKIQLALDRGGETASEITVNIYRDGIRVASQLAGATASWRDDDSSAASRSHCYALESVFTSSQNASQHSPPACFWGASGERVTVVAASNLMANGGKPSMDYSKFHYQLWGDPGDTLVLPELVPAHSGPHLLQLVAGNGAGPINTGVTAGVKSVRVEVIGGGIVAEAPVVMPQLGRWDAWRDSSFMALDLDATKRYRITIFHDAKAINMSAFSHFSRYTAGLGGSDGAFHRVNIAELKLLALDPS